MEVIARAYTPGVFFYLDLFLCLFFCLSLSPCDSLSIRVSSLGVLHPLTNLRLIPLVGLGYFVEREKKRTASQGPPTREKGTSLLVHLIPKKPTSKTGNNHVCLLLSSLLSFSLCIYSSFSVSVSFK